PSCIKSCPRWLAPLTASAVACSNASSRWTIGAGAKPICRLRSLIGSATKSCGHWCMCSSSIRAQKVRSCRCGCYTSWCCTGSGDAWQETLAVLRAQGEEAAEFERVYVEAMRRLAPLAAVDHVRWYDLMRIILSWALWRRPGPERQTLLTAAQTTQSDVNRQKE